MNEDEHIEYLYKKISQLFQHDLELAQENNIIIKHIKELSIRLDVIEEQSSIKSHSSEEC